MSIYNSSETVESFISPVLPRLLTGDQSQYVHPGIYSGVGSTGTTYRELLARWELPLYLQSGTLGMRSAGRKYLPQEPKETDTHYSNRLNRTILHGGYARTVKTLSNLPFIDPILYKNIPDDLSYLETRATPEGESLSALAIRMLTLMFDRGLTYILVDMPQAPEGINLAEERALGLRPYFAHIDPVNVIGWQVDDEGLYNVRIYESTAVPNGDYEEKLVDRIRVIYRDRHDLFEMTTNAKNQSEWMLIDSRPHSLGYIPLIPVYANKTGFMQATPVLEELAWENLSHYQKLSDLNNIEHVANVPFLFGSGFEEGELDDVEIGPSNLIISTIPEADLRYVEHSGKAIGMSQKSIEAVEKRMISMGADPLTDRATGRQTAYAKMVDASQSMSVLQSMVKSLEMGLEVAYAVAGDWLDLDTREVNLTIGEGIDLSLDANDITNLIDLKRGGELSVEDLQHELQRRGKISDTTVLKDTPQPEVVDKTTTDQGELDNAITSNNQ